MMCTTVVKKISPVLMDDEETNQPPFDNEECDGGQDHERDRETGILLKPRPKTKKQSIYNVLF